METLLCRFRFLIYRRTSRTLSPWVYFVYVFSSILHYSLSLLDLKMMGDYCQYSKNKEIQLMILTNIDVILRGWISCPRKPFEFYFEMCSITIEGSFSLFSQSTLN